MKHNIHSVPLLIVATACAPKPQAPIQSQELPASVIVLRGGDRPRYDLTGERIACMTGPEGERQIQVITLATGETKAFGAKGDDIDPSWTPDGRIVFASNRDGDFDLWLLDPESGATEPLTDLPGDETEPTVASVRFGFYAVHQEGAQLVDSYYKVLFTRHVEKKSEVWFSSIAPQLPLPVPSPQSPDRQPSPHATHQGRVSPTGRRCSEPGFAPDGLSVVWNCEGVVEDAPGKYAQSFQAALALVKGPSPTGCHDWEEDFDFDKCLQKLEKRYSTYEGKAVSAASDGLAHPSVSANQTVLIADANGRPMYAPRFASNPDWKPLPIEHGETSHLVWSPSGREIAFAHAAGIGRAETDFYLQSVRNLHRFPMLFGEGESSLLKTNRFVVRPADHKEFYVLHEQLRYAEQPQFISTDVALQAFRDEFLRLLENGEKEAAKSVRQISQVLYEHYVKRLGARRGPSAAIDRYYAVLFATAWAPLEAAATMERATTEELMQAHWGEPNEESTKRLERLQRSVAARLPEELPRVVEQLPPSIRDDVKGHIEQMLAHTGIEPLTIPGRAQPYKVDFSQFAIRGAYAENELGAYFLAMNWLGTMPLPIDPSLRGLIDTLRSKKVGDKTALAAWRRVDAVVGSFLGRPVDATLEHVATELDNMPRFDRAVLEAQLLKRRGEVPIRDANGTDRALFVTVFPKRIGLDVTFFRALTHPKVETRGMPSSLDVFATLGNARAREHSLAAAGELRDKYQAALDELAEQTPTPGSDEGYSSTDLYHSWLAVLVALADPLDLPEQSALHFAKTSAWHDRQLYSALAGYVQLKHSAVLYAMQDMGVEKDSQTSYFVAVEQPIKPRPRGFVEPNVAFYDGLAQLAGQAYARLYHDPNGPTALQWADENEPRLNAMNFAKDLAAIARKELSGKPLSDTELGFIEDLAGKLEPLTIGMQPLQASFSIGGEGREQRGVALVTDIHSNSTREQVIEIGTGRIFDLWVVVPDDVGERLTQGGIFSFYEFTAPMSERLTDEQWGSRIQAGELPARPKWTESFIEVR